MDSIMAFIVLNFDPIMRTLIMVFMLIVLFGGLAWSDYSWRKEEQRLIESGELKVLSQADYNQAFGIENDFALDEDEPLPSNVIPFRKKI